MANETTEFIQNEIATSEANAPAEEQELTPVINFHVEYDDREFMRRTLVALSEDKYSPVDILSAEFAEPKMEMKDFLFVSGTASADFTCMIGNDRQEEYWDKEKYTKDGQTYYRDVKRTRTVTDWSPFSGHNSGKYYGVVCNGNSAADDDRAWLEGEADRQLKYFQRMQEALNREETEEEKAKRCEEKEEHFDIDETSVRQAESTFISRCAMQGLTGDHHKDLKYSGTANVEKISGMRFPFYSVSYKYRGENCKAQAIASSQLPVKTEYPHAEEAAEKEKTLKKKRMPFLIGAIGSFVLFILFFALSQFATWLEALGGLAIVGCGVSLFLFFFMKKKILDKIVHERLLIKKELLVKELAKRGYAPLTPDEEKRF